MFQFPAVEVEYISIDSAYRLNRSPARVVLALIDVLVAVAAGKAKGAGAVVVLVVGRWRAGGTVGALVVLARVHLGLASPAGEGRFAVALEVVVDVGARAPVFAG